MCKSVKLLASNKFKHPNYEIAKANIIDYIFVFIFIACLLKHLFTNQPLQLSRSSLGIGASLCRCSYIPMRTMQIENDALSLSHQLCANRVNVFIVLASLKTRPLFN